MPQMSPLMWIPLLMFNLLMLYLLINTTHYLTTPIPPSTNCSTKIQTLSEPSKWKFLF